MGIERLPKTHCEVFSCQSRMEISLPTQNRHYVSGALGGDVLGTAADHHDPHRPVEPLLIVLTIVRKRPGETQEFGFTVTGVDVQVRPNVRGGGRRRLSEAQYVLEDLARANRRSWLAFLTRINCRKNCERILIVRNMVANLSKSTIDISSMIKLGTN